MNLYHYTTSYVLTEILKKNEIWFTDFRFLNDASEGTFAEKIIDATLPLIDFESRIIASQEIEYEQPLGHYTYKNFVSNFKSKLRPKSQYDPYKDYTDYVFSLSEDDDSLSQWRAYGKGELCIEFDAEKLKQLTGTSLIKVHYQELGKPDTRLAEAISIYLDDVLGRLQRNRRLDPETVFDGHEDLVPFFRRYPNSMSIKHLGFEDECEQRLVLQLPVRAGSQPGAFIDGARYPTPRVKVPICDKDTHISEVITGVVFGPGSDEVRAYNSVKALDLAFGTRLSPRTFFSKIPYRT